MSSGRPFEALQIKANYCVKDFSITFHLRSAQHVRSAQHAFGKQLLSQGKPYLWNAAEDAEFIFRLRKGSDR
jgi:hypothetical protein